MAGTLKKKDIYAESLDLHEKYRGKIPGSDFDKKNIAFFKNPVFLTPGKPLP
jgi:hypothetical protein